jgi:hypothetical protein
MNDSNWWQVSPNKICSKSSYILFYRRQKSKFIKSEKEMQLEKELT